MDDCKDEYVKLNTHGPDWYIGRLVGQTEERIEIDVFTASANGRNVKGSHFVPLRDIAGIERLPAEVRQGIKLTVEFVPDIAGMYKKMLESGEPLPSRVGFGRRRDKLADGQSDASSGEPADDSSDD